MARSVAYQGRGDCPVPRKPMPQTLNPAWRAEADFPAGTIWVKSPAMSHRKQFFPPPPSESTPWGDPNCPLGAADFPWSRPSLFRNVIP